MKKKRFQGTCVRLFSMLHACALATIEDAVSSQVEDIHAYEYDLLDAAGLGPETMTSLKQSVCKVQLIYQWIQQLIVENQASGVLCVPPPILSRSIQELANGMVAFHAAEK